MQSNLHIKLAQQHYSVCCFLFEIAAKNGTTIRLGYYLANAWTN